MFDDAVAFVLHHEGGFVEDPNDPGGATNFGISQRFLDGIGDARFAADITIEGAMALYKEYFWDAIRGDELPPSLALMVFDAAVNQGPGTAARALQRSVGAKADGFIGPRTIAAAYSAGPAKALVNIAAERAVGYGNLDTFQHYGRGWMRRLFACYTEALVTTEG
jgi:lysozyme family protein|tara:strand:- start:14 stop:508 length:495 start_codon:yes stop_codon:yes gene_type:complete